MTSFIVMAGDSADAFSVPIVLFIVLVICVTVSVVVWLTKRNKSNTRKSTKSQIKENVHPGKVKGNVSRPAKKKSISLSKVSQNQQHKFEHPHLLTNLKGHTGTLTGADFSPNGKQYVTASEVARSCPFVEKSEECKQFKAINHNEDANCWATNSLSSSATPSDTEDSITSSSSSGSKVSCRQKKNRKRKKCNEYTNNSWNEEKKTRTPVNVRKNNIRNADTFLRIQQCKISEEKLHKLLLPLCINVQERILSGYPYETYRGTYVYKALGFSRLEAVLGDHRLVEAEIEGVNLKNSQDCLEDETQNNFMQSGSVSDLSVHFSSYKNSNLDVQKCMRCRLYFDVASNGETLCFYHPKKAVLTAGGDVRYTCCNLLKTDSGCFVSTYHVFHHLSSGINGPLRGFVSTQNYDCSTPRVFGLDCEMVFTSLGFEVARVTVVNVHGKTQLDLYVRPEGRVFDYNTQFSGITEHHFSNAVSFCEARKMVLDLVNSSDVLVGHSLEGDLVVLKILHRKIVDTALLFKVISNEADSRRGSPLPQRQALKSLVKEHLGQDIQKEGQGGHSSVEDATAALNLVLSQVCGERLRHDKRKSKIAPMPSILLAITA